jgi:hypothetical protein
VKVLNTFVSHKGTVAYKKEDTLGRVYYHVPGADNPRSKQSYQAVASHQTPGALKRGYLSADDLEDPADFAPPYDATSVTNIDAFEEGSAARSLVAERNKFYGFYASADTPDDRIEAMKQYREMTARLADADSEAAEERIKREYNIGGSE